MNSVQINGKEIVLELENSKVRIYEAGDGYPTICLHGVGFANGANTWLPCIHEGLAENLRILALDQLGWGTADRPTWNYTLPFLVDHVREVQDKLGLEKINLVGHSLGGWVAALFAYESPERLNKLVLVANAGMKLEPPANLASFEPPTREAIAEGFASFEDEDFREFLTEQAWRNVTTPNAVEAFAKINEGLHDMDMRRRYHLGRRLSSIKVPTMMVYGTRDRNYPPETIGKQMHEGIPHARFETLDSAHAVPIQRPAELAALIRDFLE
jgi:pimeloyl-ACP methyl ester carboxylesterase